MLSRRSETLLTGRWGFWDTYWSYVGPVANSLIKRSSPETPVLPAGGDRREAGAIGTDHVESGLPVEHDEPSVGRPVHELPERVHEQGLIRAIGVHQIDPEGHLARSLMALAIPGGGEGDLRSEGLHRRD